MIFSNINPYHTQKIIVDTSIWIDYFNGQDNAHCDFLENLLSLHKVAICDVILLEILQGFKNDKDYENAKTLLLNLNVYETMNSDNSILYADYYRQLRKKGITIRKTIDVIIAGFCIKNNLPLLFSDRDFLPFCEHLNLKSAFTIQ